MYERFQKLLDENNVTPYQVSKCTGVNRTTLSNWKNNKYIPKLDKLKKIGDYFGVSAEWLHGDSDSRVPYEFHATTSPSTSNNVSLSAHQMQNLPMYLENALQILKENDIILINDIVLDKTSKKLIELNLQNSIDVINTIFENIS